MQIPATLKRRLVDEIGTVVQSMQTTTDPFVKLYLFSAAFGEIGRVLNYHWDANLAACHILLQGAHGTLSTRLQNMTTGVERGIRIPNEALDALTSATEELKYAISSSSDSQLWKALARIAEITYAATGNGYYLYTKGVIKLGGSEAPHTTEI